MEHALKEQNIILKYDLDIESAYPSRKFCTLSLE